MNKIFDFDIYKLNKLRASSLISFFLAASMLLYSLRGKVGAAAISALMLLLSIGLLNIKRKGCPNGNRVAFIFLICFAFAFNILRSLSPQYYLIVGYLVTPIILLDTNILNYNRFWKWLRIIAIIEATGVYTQRFFPQLYFLLMKQIMPGNVMESLVIRQMNGYYTGFTREVSYTMLFIVVGLGLYIYKFNDLDKKKRIISIIYLLVSLFLSGKKATLVFFVFAFFIVQFILSNSKLKILKYISIAVIAIFLIAILYPIWGNMTIFSRMNELIHNISIRDYTAMTSGRTRIYEHAISLWETNKWFGIGWGNFKYSVPSKFWYSGFDVHNCLLQVLCETGIIGLLFYVIVNIYCFINSIRAVYICKKHNKNMFNLSVFCCFFELFFFLYSMTEPILYEYPDYVLFFVCFSCSNILSNKKNRKESLEGQ